MEFYRFVTSKREYSPKLELEKYKLLKETPKGYWIIPDYCTLHNYMVYDEEDNIVGKKEKKISDYYDKHWISKTGKRRYAYPSIKEALVNYVKRTQRYVQILESKINDAYFGLSYVKTYQLPTGETVPVDIDIKPKLTLRRHYDSF